MVLIREKIETAMAETEVIGDIVEKFVAALGFEEGDSVYLRLLPPKDFDPNNPAHQAEFPKCWFILTIRVIKSINECVVESD